MKIAALLSSFRVQNYYKNYYKKSTYANFSAIFLHMSEKISNFAPCCCKKYK